MNESPRPANSRAWFPCEHPEQPNDAFMVWHVGGCHGCYTAAIATQRRHPDDPHVKLMVGITRPREPLSVAGFFRWTARAEVGGRDD